MNCSLFLSFTASRTNQTRKILKFTNNQEDGGGFKRSHYVNNKIQYDLKSTREQCSCSQTSVPYRTVSHFGFNTPKRALKPDHKHVPLYAGRYILPRGITYDEIFASKRFADKCAGCLSRALKLKLNVTPGSSDDCTSSSLDTIHEDEEYQAIASKFEDKIMRFTYEKESPYIGFVLTDEHLVARSASYMRSDELDGAVGGQYVPRLKDVGGEGVPRLMDVGDEGVPRLMDVGENEVREDSYYEGNPSDEEDSYEDARAICNGKEVSCEENDEKADNNEAYSSNKKKDTDENIVLSPRLMGREERIARKEEFVELWQDHVDYYSNKESGEEDDNNNEVYKSITYLHFNGSSEYNSFEDQESSKSVDIHENNIDSVRRSLRYDDSSDEDNNNPENEQFSPIERLILDKIEKIDSTEPIFEKIEDSIRNKLTPRKIDQILGRSHDDHYRFKRIHAKKFKSKPYKRCFNTKATVKDNAFITFRKTIYKFQTKQQITSTFSKQPKKKSVPKSPEKAQESKNNLSKTPSSLLKKKHRNFIVENIKNCSSTKKKNLRNSPAQEGRPKTPSVYCFKADENDKSPKFWVSISPRSKNSKKLKENISKTLKTMNEVEILQKDIENCRQDLNKQLCDEQERQQVTCNLLTYSISEDDD